MTTLAKTSFEDQQNSTLTIVSNEACFHCGLANSSSSFGVTWDGRHRRMCCVGCESVAAFIIASGMEDFYRHRTGYSTRPDENTPSVVAHTATATPAKDSAPGSTPVNLYLRNLTCAACVWLAEKTLNRQPGVSNVRVNFTTHSVNLLMAQANTESLIQALRKVGLIAEKVGDTSRAASRQHDRRKQLVHLGIAGLAMMQVMMLTVPIYLATSDELSANAKLLMSWSAWLLTLPALLISARPMFIAAWRGLIGGHVGMDLPVTIALLLTFVASTHTLLTDNGHLYLDAITMFIFLLLAARWVEASIRDRAIRRIERMTNPKPVIVARLLDYPTSETHERVHSNALCSDDIIIVEQGTVVAADGVILRGATEIDEALMTGESSPIHKQAGDTVVGGTMNTAGSIVVKVTAVGDQSVLAQLARLVDTGLMGRPPFQGIADVLARYIAPVTLLLALTAALIWLMVDPSKSLAVAVAVLAVTCPCAFALAAPTAAAAAIGNMVEHGLLVVRGHVLESLATATDIVFDKTGTVTTGVWQLRSIHCDPSARRTHIAICDALESGAIHPVARAVKLANAPANSSTRSFIATSLTQVAGAGVEGVIDGQCYRFGTAAFAGVAADATTQGIVDSDPVVVLSTKINETWRHLATLKFTDPLRPYAAATMAQFIRRGLRVHLLSGDHPDVVAAVARECGLEPEYVRAKQSAVEKRDYIAALQSAGRTVVAIGDGLNDGPMLAAANVGIGLASGAAMTRMASDAVADESKKNLFQCIHLAFEQARAAMTITRQNFCWALAYNVIALPLAFAGLVTPLIASLGMAASSLVVVINASRIWLWNRSGS